MKRLIFITVLIVSGLLYVNWNYPIASAQDADQQKIDLQKKIAEYESKLVDIRSQKNTLSAQIDYMDTQIYLTGLKISDSEEKIKEAEKEINVLGTRIANLDSSLDNLSKTLLERIVAGYKTRDISLLDIVLDSSNTANLVNRLKYYDLTRNKNQKALLQVQETKSNFEEQKDLREKKVEQLDKLKSELDQQNKDLKTQQFVKQDLLKITQNDEKNYQQLLAQAKAEYAAIQQITAGGGKETELREVKKGDNIATIISGKSCNSSGSHLHFIVKEGDAVVNPFSKLKSVEYDNDSNGDDFNPSGSWDWPLSPKITLHQGYGITWFVKTYSWYPAHNGIDITGSSYDILAVEDGTLYKGTYSGFNGCALSYVKVKHKDSNISTLYLHVYPN